MIYVKNVYFVKTKKTRAHFEYLFVHSVAGRLVSLFFMLYMMKISLN